MSLGLAFLSFTDRPGLTSDELLGDEGPKEEWCAREVWVGSAGAAGTSADVEGVLARVSFVALGVAADAVVVDFRASCAAGSPCSAAASISARSSGVMTTSMVDVRSDFSLRWLYNSPFTKDISPI